MTEKGVLTGWEALALPFAPTAIVHSINGECVPFRAYDPSFGKKPFWLCEMTSSGFAPTDVIKANKGYIVCMPNNKDYGDEYILGGNGDITYKAEKVRVPVTASAYNDLPTMGEYTFWPNYMHLAQSDSVMVINKTNYGSNKPGSVFVPDQRPAYPFEAYVTQRLLSSGEAAPLRIDSDVSGLMDIMYDLGDVNRSVYSENGSLFIYSKGSGEVNIYKTNDVTKAPTKFISYTNGLGVGIGARLHVQGDLNSNAVITATPYSCNNAIRWIVKDGRVGNPENILMSVAAWGAQDDAAKVVGVDAEGKNGSIVDYYQGGVCQMYYLSDWKTSANLVQDNSGNAWGYNTAAIDVRPFNKARYLALFEMGYWPDWGLTGHIYLYDASNPASVTGTTDGSSMLKYAYTIPDNFGSVGYASDGRFADVLVTPSEDGYFLYIFYASNTHLSFGGIQVDCIKK